MKSFSFEIYNHKKALLTDNQALLERETFGKAHLFFLGLIALISWVIILCGRDLISNVITKYYFQLPAYPYLGLEDPVRFYLLIPPIVGAGILTWLFPGIFFTLLLRKPKRITELIVWAFGISYLVYIPLIWVVRNYFHGKSTPDNFVFGTILLGLLGWLCLAGFFFRGGQPGWPPAQVIEKRRLAWIIAIPLLALFLLFPLIFWQDMHGDAVEIFELGKSLSQFWWPRFPSMQGVAGLGIGMAPMAFPVHWFIALFGEIEAAARLPLLLYLPVIFCLLVELIEWQLPQRLGIVEESLLVLALAVITETLSFNASYDPYFADIASPMVIDLFEIIALMAVIYFLWRQEWLFLAVWVLLAIFGRPTGIFVLGLLAVGVFIFFPEKRRSWLPILLGLILSCLFLGLLYDRVLLPILSGTAEISFSSSSIIGRIRYIRMFEFLRLNFGIFPVGILPFFALFFFNWQDNYARLISFITLGYFLIFLFVAFTALHHFIPIMVLPLIVMWRIVLLHPVWDRRIVFAAVIFAGVVSLTVSLPRSFTINRTIRSIGQKIDIKLGADQLDFQTLISHEGLFSKIVQPDWLVDDPAEELVSTPLALIYYATRPKNTDSSGNYLIQLLSEPAPTGYSLVGSDQTASLYVHDQAEWNADRFQNWNTEYRSPLYAIPRGTLYYYRVETKGTRVFDLIELLGGIKHRVFN